MGEETEEEDADETARQCVQQKPPQELLGAVSVISRCLLP